MEQRSNQRTRQTPLKQPQANSQDYFDQEYDDIWPTRMPSSARRYYSSDVGSDVSRMGADAEAMTLSEYPSTRPGRKSSVPARSTATQTNASMAQTRRTGTQTGIPASQTRRTGTQTGIPASQTRHTSTRTEIPVTQGRRTGTQGHIPAIQGRHTGMTAGMPTTQTTRRTGTQSNLPAMQGRRTGTQGSLPAVQSKRSPFIHTDETITHDRETPEQKQQSTTRFHWLFYVGLAMLVMTLMWGGLSALNSWWQVKQDDLHYGRPRTYQIDQAVGHNDAVTPSHFIALNLNRHIEVIEFPGGDPTKARIYIGPVLMGQGQDLAPATLEFRDVNGDGKPDMIVKVQDSRFIFINDNGSFRPLRPGEVVHL